MLGGGEACKTPPEDALWYLDAVEEALCFGWIDSTLKSVNGEPLQRFGPRTKSGRWTELNKERCRRLEKLGLMTESGRKVCPNLTAKFEIMPEIVEVFKKTAPAWKNFQAMPPLYQRVRIDNIQRVKANTRTIRWKGRLQIKLTESELSKQPNKNSPNNRITRVRDRSTPNITFGEVMMYRVAKFMVT